jgi:hypothetical protein
MAVQAVYCEPVSAEISLLTGKIQGNHVILGHRRPETAQISPRSQQLSNNFPTPWIREILWHIRDILLGIKEASVT